MAAKETTLEELAEMLTHVVEHMATKEDIANMATKEDLAGLREEMRTEFKHVHSELAEIRLELDDLRKKFENVSGYRKEIDYVLERVSAIEKHLGIEKKIAA